jgi:hypothetical protein
LTSKKIHSTAGTMVVEHPDYESSCFPGQSIKVGLATCNNRCFWIRMMSMDDMAIPMAAIEPRCVSPPQQRLLVLPVQRNFGTNSCVDEDLMCVSAEHWLSDVLAKLVNGWPASRLNELLPWASTYTMNAHDPRLAA